MRILAADDEGLMLEALTDAIREAVPEAEIHGFQKPSELLHFAEHNSSSIAFLDVQMRSMSGLEVAKKLKELNPMVNIIFVTGYEQYGSSAMQLHASGYIMKPVTGEKIKEELSDLRHPLVPLPRTKLRVRCFGYFEVFNQDEPLLFARARTKELFAYLVDRRGGVCTAEELIAALWEDDGDLFKRKNQLRVLTSDLKHTLSACGAEDVLVRASNRWAIRTELLDCDYYRMLQSDVTAINAYCGQYMLQYSWAEFTAGALFVDHQK